MSKWKRKRRRNRAGKRGMSEAKKMFLERAGWANRHHMLNRVNGGGREQSNMLLMDERRHAAFHLVFNNLDFIRAAKVLIRAHNMKKGTKFFIAEGGSYDGF